MYFSIIAVVLIMMNTVFLTASRDMIFASKATFIQSQAGTIAANLSDIFTSLTLDGVAQIMSRIDLKGVTHVTITGSDGAPVYDKSSEDDDKSSGYQPDDVKTAMAGNDIFFSRFLNGTFASSAYTPVTGKDGNIIGAVYVHEYDVEQGRVLLGLQSTIQNVSIIIAGLSICMVFFMLWTIMRRITSILKAIESVREGEYNYRINVKGNDELALLGDEFNSLTSRLRETEEIRRRFVADASHELKTPLASIRLLSDSILQNEDMDIDTVREFISDIGSEAGRLSRTTEKLMTLTRLDTNVSHDEIITGEKTSVDIREVVLKTLRMLRPLADSNQITLSERLAGGCIVRSTEDEIHQIVFNLIENAIKYNLPGGSVTTTLRHDGDSIYLTVDDTGIGVPDDDLPYIFDRFYRVDKARSRASGGSGLGLSIVRETVLDNDGTITAEKRHGGGMRFQVRFPGGAYKGESEF
jgi:signal transduction histidine kinase